MMRVAVHMRTVAAQMRTTMLQISFQIAQERFCNAFAFGAAKICGTRLTRGATVQAFAEGRRKNMQVPFTCHFVDSQSDINISTQMEC
jgi:hypothetical protein